MSLIEDVFKNGNIATGLAVGIGAAVVIPLAMPVIRPLSKAAVKAGLMAYDQGRVAFAELSERTNDLVAEARTEMQSGETARSSKRPRQSEQQSDH